MPPPPLILHRLCVLSLVSFGGEAHPNTKALPLTWVPGISFSARSACAHRSDISYPSPEVPLGCIVCHQEETRQGPRYPQLYIHITKDVRSTYSPKDFQTGELPAIAVWRLLCLVILPKGMMDLSARRVKQQRIKCMNICISSVHQPNELTMYRLFCRRC